jgi:hypothetical protein
VLAEVAGRTADGFQFGSVQLPAAVLREVLAAQLQVIEYQVRQEPRGVHVEVVCSSPLDQDALAGKVRAKLQVRVWKIQWSRSVKSSRWFESVRCRNCNRSCRCIGAKPP